MLINAGDRFRHYRVIERVGEGGMGVVYRAHDEQLGRDVALKFMLDATRMTAAHRDRLWREARALAALNHPNILTIHDVGDADGVPFLVVEWIGGGALSGRAAGRPMAASEFFDVAVPVAEALGAAHAQGIVHRDVKPSNVLISTDGRVKLADFGLATIHDLDPQATRTAGIVGTMAYMSPEQAGGARTGPASAVFSFGVLAYELLTAQRPFTDRGPGGLIGAIVNGRHTPIAQVRGDLPRSLTAIVERCLEPAPSGRFKDGNALAQALRQTRAQPAASSSSPTAQADDRVPTTRVLPRDQEIRFCTTADGVTLAYSAVGTGPVIVRVLSHFTHLEMEWEWPDLRRFWEQLADHHTVIRYDGRGMGLSDPFTGEFTEDTRQFDLDAVLNAVGADQAVLLGVSEGGWTAATYVHAHPKRISHLVLYGAYCRGAHARPGFDPEEETALLTLIRKGWGRDTPAFRQVFTSQFFRPDADPRLIAHFNELQRVSANPETAARYYGSLQGRGDGRDLFRRLRLPTLVIHSRDDMAVSAEEGRLLASVIPGAQLVLLPSGAHYFPTDSDVASKAAGAITRFLASNAASGS